jgi:hypothetical protein
MVAFIVRRDLQNLRKRLPETPKVAEDAGPLDHLSNLVPEEGQKIVDYYVHHRRKKRKQGFRQLRQVSSLSTNVVLECGTF